MAIGMTPLIPLDRVVPVPDARLQRFGVNNSQLFGKPMVTFGAGLLDQPAETIRETPRAEAAPKVDSGIGAASGTGPAEPAVAAAPALASGYSKWTGSGSGTGAAPAAGSLVDLKA